MLWLLIGYIWLYVHRPFEVWQSLATFRLERVYMLGVLLCWLVHPQKSWVPNRLNAAFCFFLIAVLVTWVASPYMELGTKTVEDQFKIAVLYVLILTSVRDEKSLRWLLVGYLAAVGLYMTHSLWEYHNGRHMYRMGIARMVGVDTSFNDPNTFAATLVYSLPMTVPFWFARPRGYARLLLVAYTGLSVVCIVLTGSRAGLIGLGCASTLVACASRYRRNILMLMMLGAPFVWLATPPDLKERFLTLIDPSYGPENAALSAESRTQGFYDGVALWQEQPLTGYGPNSFGEAVGHGKQAHNLYGQMLGEMGTLGLLAFGAVVLAFWNNLREVRRSYRLAGHSQDDFCYHVTLAVSLAVVVLLVMGLAGHNLYRYTWMWFGAFQAIAVHCVRARFRSGWDAAPVQGAHEGAGAARQVF